MDRRTLARQLSAIENGEMKVDSYQDGDVIAITGPPGVGKSCIVDAILHRLTPAKNVAVLAVDPTSPLSGGALLGDRIRMNNLFHERVFMRSMATRINNHSLNKHIKPVLKLLQSENFDLIILESSGIGQSDSSIINYCDFSFNLLAYFDITKVYAHFRQWGDDCFSGFNICFNTNRVVMPVFKDNF